MARWHIHAWILREKVARPEKDAHGLRRHDREVLRGREMSETKCVPDNNIRIVNRLVWITGDPFGQTQRRLATGLWYMSARRIQLLFII